MNFICRPTHPSNKGLATLTTELMKTLLWLQLLGVAEVVDVMYLKYHHPACQRRIVRFVSVAHQVLAAP